MNSGHPTGTFKEKGTPGKSVRPRHSPDNSVCSFECSSPGLCSTTFNSMGNVERGFKSLVEEPEAVCERYVNTPEEKYQLSVLLIEG